MHNPLSSAVTYTTYLKGTGLDNVFCLLSFFSGSAVLRGNVFFNHFPALTNRAVVAARSPEMVLTPFPKMREFLSKLTEYFGGYWKNMCTWSTFMVISMILIPISAHVPLIIPSVTKATSPVRIFLRYFGVIMRWSVSRETVCLSWRSSFL